jgi:hypothetical protein
MIDPKMLKEGNAYSFKENGMDEPALVVVEKIEGGLVVARDKESNTARTWAIEAFARGANEMTTIVVPLGNS